MLHSSNDVNNFSFQTNYTTVRYAAMCIYLNKARPIAGSGANEIDGHIKLIQICIIALPRIHVVTISYLWLVVTFSYL